MTLANERDFYQSNNEVPRVRAIQGQRTWRLPTRASRSAAAW